MLGSSGKGEWGRGILGLPKPLGWELGPHRAFLTGCVGAFGPLPFVTASSPSRTPPCFTILPTPTPQAVCLVCQALPPSGPQSDV